jgi:hypothetical protein
MYGVCVIVGPPADLGVITPSRKGNWEINIAFACIVGGHRYGHESIGLEPGIGSSLWFARNECTDASQCCEQIESDEVACSHMPP